MGFIAVSNGVVPAEACGPLVANRKSPLADSENPEIVTTSVDPPSEIVGVAVENSPSLEVVVDESVAMLELEVGGLELEVTVVVDLPVTLMGGAGFELGVTGGTIDNVVFWAGHPEDPVSRRTGQ